MSRTGLIGAVVILALAAGCGTTGVLGDSTYSCVCNCGICDFWICDEFDPDTFECVVQECVSRHAVIFNEVACANVGDTSGARTACTERCSGHPNDFGCGVGEPVLTAAHSCAIHSPARVLAEQSPLGTHALIDPAHSSVAISLTDGSSALTNGFGDLYFDGGDCPGAACGMTITWLSVRPHDLTAAQFNGHTESGVNLLNNGSLAGSKDAADHYIVPPFNLSFNGGGVLDGTFSSAEGLAGGPMSGTIDYANGKMDISGSFVSPDGTVTVDVLLSAVLDNRPPVADAGANQTAQCGTITHLDGTGSHDPDGVIASYNWYLNPGSSTQSPLGSGASLDVALPLGHFPIGLRVTDNRDSLGSAATVVDVVDTQPPALSCPNNLTLECANGSATASFVASASDSCGGATFDCTTPSGAVLPDGAVVHDTCTAHDTHGNSSSCSFDIAVVDSAGPVVTQQADAHGFSATLWPPSHDYRNFSLSSCVTSAVDACEGAIDLASAAHITRIVSDEPENDTGDGNTCNDAAITGNTTALLRAERDGGSDGRVYTVHFYVADQRGNRTSSTCRVQVPHDQDGGAAIDSGAAFCVGAGCGTVRGHDPTCTR